MKQSKLIVLFTFLISLSAFADEFCGVVLAKNGLNVRTLPTLGADILYKLHEGETFKFHPGSYTGKYRIIKDDTSNLKGQWIKIELNNTYEEFVESKEGYIFFAPQYAKEIYDCREYRYKIFENEIYNPVSYGDHENNLKKIDTLKSILNLKHVYLESVPKNEKDQYLKTTEFYNASEDTILLQLANSKQKKIISYPYGKNNIDEEKETYQFKGYLKRLNSYLIQGFFWESSSYFFINKKTGNKSIEFYGIPNISPNNKFAIIVEQDTFEEVSHIWLYEIVNGEMQLKIDYVFSDWVIDGDIYWLSNSEIIIPARSVKDNKYNWVEKDSNYDAEKESYDIKKQYVKVQIL